MKKVGSMVYLLRNGEVAFLVRHKKDDKVHQQGILISIGGKLEDGESPEACAKRELFEEAHVVANKLTLKAVLHFRSFGTMLDDWTNFVFVCDDFSGEPQPGNEGHFVWVHKEEISSANVYPGDKIFLSKIFDLNFLVIDFKYDGFSYLSSASLVEL
ncbi:MAG: NUDIX domain-containing protein [bacterium]|nr:NUDIX domain-containing protein [bacterium]